MLDKIRSEWKNYQFGITYSVTLGRDDLETSLAIRNTGERDFEFQTLLHSYWAIDVSVFDQGYRRRDGENEAFERQADGEHHTGHLEYLGFRARKGLLRRQSRRRKERRIWSYHYLF